MAATTQNLAAFRAAWDAAMQVYDTAHGATGTNLILGSYDMNSTIHAPAGLWDLVGSVVPTQVPNSNLKVRWTDGTSFIELSYDELLVADRVARVLDGFFGPDFKVYHLLTRVNAAVATLGAAPYTWADYMAFMEDLGGRYTPADEYGLELPGLMG